MTITVEFWDLVKLLLGVLGIAGAFGKILLVQIDRRLDDRFAAQDQARVEGATALRSTLNEHLADERKNAERLKQIEESIGDDLKDMSERLSGVETEVDHGFSRTDVEAIYNRINTVAQDLSELRGESRGVADNLRLLMNQITQRGFRP